MPRLLGLVFVRALALTPCALVAGCDGCTSSTAGSSGSTGSAAMATEKQAMTFPLQDGWTGGRGACTDVEAGARCDGEWHHGSGQVARVYLIDIDDPQKVVGYHERLGTVIRARGGIAERIGSGAFDVLRFLEPRSAALGDAGVVELVALNYSIVVVDPGSAGRSATVFLVTSVVPHDLHQDADVRLRNLVDSAQWVPR